MPVAGRGVAMNQQNIEEDIGSRFDWDKLEGWREDAIGKTGATRVSTGRREMGASSFGPEFLT